MCPRHPDSPLSLFCFTDHVLLCEFCLGEPHLSCDGGTHLGHSVARKSQLLRKARQAVFSLRRELKFYVDSVLTEPKLTRDVVQSHYIPAPGQPPDRRRRKSSKAGNKRKRKQIKKIAGADEPGSDADDCARISALVNCFSPSAEPLAINFLQQIIFLEQRAAHLDTALDIVLSSGTPA